MHALRLGSAFAFAAMVRIRAGLGYFALIAFGVVSALLILESALQLGALWTGRTDAWRAFPSWLGARRVVCTGDSNTYGLWVGPEHAYPRLLEERWNATGGDRLEVANLGHPGNNSSQLRNRIDAVLRELRPDVVTILVGANDLWTLPEPVAETATERSTWKSVLWRWSRTYRLLYMVGRSRAGSTPVPDVKPVVTPAGRGQPGWSVAFRANLHVIIERTREAGAIPVLLTYPSDRDAYGMTNPFIRATAEAERVRLVDLAAAFAAECPDGKCPLLFPDQHPTAAGHELVARVLFEALAGADRPPNGGNAE